MQAFQADWVLPIVAAPIRRGWVVLDRGQILACGPAHAVPTGIPVTDLGHTAVLPGLVNAHTHLELSWLRGRIAPAASFIDWVGAMMRVRLSAPEASDEACHRAAYAVAAAEMRASGTAVVGDITNSLMGLDLASAAGLAGVMFYELLGFDVTDSAPVIRDARARLDAVPRVPEWRLTLAPHAPFSVSPGLFRGIREAVDDGATAVHVSEGADEVELIATGGGRWRATLDHMGMWHDGFSAPGCTPIAYLDRLGMWRSRTLAVHAVQATPADLDLLAAREATVVTCPRSNVFVGSGDPPVSAFYRSGVAVAVGTDSLSSVDDLNLFTELATLHRLAPEVPARRLIESATRVGARALGVDGSYGMLQPGAKAAVLAVSLGAEVEDVETRLVSGIAPAAIRWLEDSTAC